jgi:1-acyl-sn-glycerol-3-phosphate acyltransferase
VCLRCLSVLLFLLFLLLLPLLLLLWSHAGCLWAVGDAGGGWVPPAVVGQALVLSGSIVVKRGDRESGHRLIQKAMQSIQEGINVLFFPEGTRKIDGTKGPLGEFRAGAFKVAVDTGCPIVPVTITGARSMLPPRGLPLLADSSPLVVVHPPIESKVRGADAAPTHTHTHAHAHVHTPVRCFTLS